MNSLVMVYAKDPVPGRVKTRLGASIGHQLAAELYAAVVEDVLQELMHEPPSWDIEIHLDRHSNFYEGYGCPLFPQQGADLGAKLLHSLAEGLRRGANAVAIVGSDAPALRRAWLEGLFQVDADIALGPTDDGGFWGIAARKIHPAIFDGVRWSTSTANQDTAAAVTRAGLSVGFGPRGWDLDEPADLSRLIEEGCAGPHTRAVLSRIANKP